MFKCFLCCTTFLCADFLMSHLKLFHSLKTSSTYKCMQFNCFHICSNRDSFKRHLVKSHSGKLQLSASKETLSENVNSTSLIIGHSNNDTNLINTSKLSLINSETTFEDVEKSIFYFVSKLYANSALNRKLISQILNDITENVTSVIFNYLKFSIISKIKDENKTDVEELLDIFSNPFFKLDSEYKVLKQFQEKQKFELPKQFTIDNELNVHIQNYTPTFVYKDIKGVISPLKFQFQKFFELPLVLEKTLSNMENLKKQNTISNFIHGNIWKKITRCYENKIVIPYFLYIDGFEVNNPLSSHRGNQALTAIYYSFPTIPVQYLSKLENIFLALLFKSRDQKTYGNDKCLKILIKELNDLATSGLQFNINGSKTTVYFVLGLLLGDNLGINSTLGFSSTFSHKYCCRFCKLSKNQINVNTPLEFQYQRNIQNYNEDLISGNYSETGIHENSLFNDILHFHVTSNYCVDYMHDIFEGICHYNMSAIISYYVNNKIFSLNTLNQRKNLFDYGETEIGNISPNITLQHLKNHHFQMTAREMWCFVHHFTLFIGDLIPRNDEVWSFFITMLKVIDLCLLNEFNNHNIEKLRIESEAMNKKYIELFNDTPKFKHHVIAHHYIKCISESGPLRYYNSFRFESKHRVIKEYCKNTTSRVNIAYSAAMKMQFEFAHKLFDQNRFEKDIEINTTKLNPILDKSFLGIDLTMASDFDINSDIYSIDKIKRHGTLFKIGFYLTLCNPDLNLYKILNIYLLDSRVYCLCHMVEIEGFDEHLQAYIIEKDLSETFVINIDRFKAPPLHIHNTADNKTAVRLKTY